MSQHPAAQLHPWIYVSIQWQAVFNWVARPMTLPIALISECILYLSISFSHKHWHADSQLGSLQLVPMVIIISHFPSVCLWTVQAPIATTVCFIYVHAYKHGDKNGHTHTDLPSVLLAEHMPYFSLACYINRAVVYSRNKLFRWSLLPHPDVSKGHTTATTNAIMTDIILFRVLISHFEFDTNWLTPQFISQLMLCINDFSGQVGSSAW